MKTRRSTMNGSSVIRRIERENTIPSRSDYGALSSERLRRAHRDLDRAFSGRFRSTATHPGSRRRSTSPGSPPRDGYPRIPALDRSR
ncbi:MAG: hypothetical protein KIS78_29570, partial [Labilithrix sp.]|nr:hypothetical protein [Labilithrix sp.]